MKQIWDNFFKAFKHVGKELLGKGAITTTDLEAWQQSKNNKIVNVGIPAYVFMDCFLHSIKSGSTGFLLSECELLLFSLLSVFLIVLN